VLTIVFQMSKDVGIVATSLFQGIGKHGTR
jgi:hypothetical protein